MCPPTTAPNHLPISGMGSCMRRLSSAFTSPSLACNRRRIVCLSTDFVARIASKKPGSLPCPAAEITRYHVELRRSWPRRARAHDLDLVKRAREARLHLVESFAHEDLRDHRAARPQLRAREFERRHLQFECERLIALLDTAQLRREIARYEIGRPANLFRYRDADRRVAHVTGDRYDVGRR